LPVGEVLNIFRTGWVEFSWVWRSEQGFRRCVHNEAPYKSTFTFTSQYSLTTKTTLYRPLRSDSFRVE